MREGRPRSFTVTHARVTRVLSRDTNHLLGEPRRRSHAVGEGPWEDSVEDLALNWTLKVEQCFDGKKRLRQKFAKYTTV